MAMNYHVAYRKITLYSLCHSNSHTPYICPIRIGCLILYNVIIMKITNLWKENGSSLIMHHYMCWKTGYFP